MAFGLLIYYAPENAKWRKESASVQNSETSNVDRAPKDIVVIGASAGGVEALKTLAGDLSPDLPATLFVVVHLPARGRTVLPDILNRAGRMPAITANDGAPIEKGRIYVAGPDHHLLIANNHMHLTHGPKEGRHRPSINVTFRSAAMSYGERVIGVILTGMLDDGTAGLWEIKARGGTTVVQDPEDAAFASMPMSALEDVQIDFQTDLAHLGELITGLVSGVIEPPRPREPVAMPFNSTFSALTCPDCRGPVWQVRSKPIEFRCRVGHVYSAHAIIEEHTAMQERKLYEAILALEEGADIAEFLAARSEQQQRERLMVEAEQLRAQSEMVKNLLQGRKVTAVG
jgi:two-component system chemotaxis response regulator CheB